MASDAMGRQGDRARVVAEPRKSAAVVSRGAVVGARGGMGERGRAERGGWRLAESEERAAWRAGVAQVAGAGGRGVVVAGSRRRAGGGRARRSARG